MHKFFALMSVIGDAVTTECPCRILEISGGGTMYGHLLRAFQIRCGITDGVIDRIAVPGTPPLPDNVPYNRVVSVEAMAEGYDFVLITDLPDESDTKQVIPLLDMLRQTTTRQIMVVTPLYNRAGLRKYHPLVFLGMDFCYSTVDIGEDIVQIYGIFPKIKYPELPVACAGNGQTAPLRIAFVLPHSGLTGGMKALLQQIRHLTRRGHTVDVYFRSDTAVSAIPAWSDLTGDDCGHQIVIPPTGWYVDYITDADVIFLGWMCQLWEFTASSIPVVLWEQGSEMIFGDFGQHLHSRSQERLTLHYVFRMPVHLLAVSDTVATVLKGVYNRDSLLFSGGVDTEFYHPADHTADKENPVPTVMLSGTPSLSFKGFDLALAALHTVHEAGIRFKVKWASQTDVYGVITEFPLELIICPSQFGLAELYRTADVFLSASLYEAYSLPPLEAMASGTAVVAADCGGIRAYAVNGENCILCPQGDAAALAAALTELLTDCEKRRRLAAAGRTTAMECSAEITSALLERHLTDIVGYVG